MRIAILGASSQIASDLIQAFSTDSEHALGLFARRPTAVQEWQQRARLPRMFPVASFEAFGSDHNYDAIINFVGVGNPAKTEAMGAAIFDVTLIHDMMALDYIQTHQACRYIFLSSGAAYGSTFEEPVDADTVANVAINGLKPQDWYAVAKLYAECRHRALPALPITDVRVFNYFSRTQDISARFFITDLLRAARDGAILKTSGDYMVRDYIHPSDFYQLIEALLQAPPANTAIDCYSAAPVDKPALLQAMHTALGLRYEVTDNGSTVNATGSKPYYYSLNRRAADFGYKPYFTSIDGVLHEARAMLALAAVPHSPSA
ncbi:NAD-dependent epimerase/dehydratase family protein [Polaromonas aquatica]|uniref:NAD-dependent epimerase/dehydratase family protein n=1 Tax=Polaromonas aquatica TaxID=332657 RepID=UPI003D66292E